MPRKPIHGLRIADRAAWVKKVRAALEKAGTIHGAAALLEVSHRTLEDWLYGSPCLPPSPELTKGIKLRNGHKDKDSAA